MHKEVFNKKLENTFKSPEMKNMITERKNTLERCNSRINDTEKWINKLEDRVVDITAADEKKVKMKRNENSLRNLWDNIKYTNIHIIGVPKGEEREKGLRRYLKT